MFEADILGRFTTHLKEALQKGLAFTITCGRDLVEPGDLMIDSLKKRGRSPPEMLGDHISLDQARQAPWCSASPSPCGAISQICRMRSNGCWRSALTTPPRTPLCRYGTLLAAFWTAPQRSSRTQEQGCRELTREHLSGFKIDL